MVTRREIMLAMGAGALLPLTSFAQQPGKVWRIGILAVRSPAASREQIGIFKKGLGDLGRSEGADRLIDARFASGDVEKLPALTADLLRAKPDVILAISSFAVKAARQATATVPIVMAGVGDPIASGFVASLARPGGNITGLTNLSVELSGKYLEFLHATVPKLSRVAVLINPAHPNHPEVLRQVRSGAKSIGAKIVVFEVGATNVLEQVLAKIGRENPGALIVPPDPSWTAFEPRIVEAAAKNRIPTMFGVDSAVEAGGLLSYQPNWSDMYRRAAGMVDKILKGVKPSDIPVENPIKFDLAINMKTAKALGIKVPQSILIQATKVIE